MLLLVDYWRLIGLALELRGSGGGRHVLGRSVTGAVSARRAGYGFVLGRMRRWYSPNRMNVGGHWPTNSAQSFLFASLSAADTPIEARAAQYHDSSGMLSVTRKNLRYALSFASII